MWPAGLAGEGLKPLGHIAALGLMAGGRGLGQLTTAAAIVAAPLDTLAVPEQVGLMRRNQRRQVRPGRRAGGVGASPFGATGGVGGEVLGIAFNAGRGADLRLDGRRGAVAGELCRGPGLRAGPGREGRDRIMAALLERRARVGEAAAAVAVPSRDEILAAILDAPQAVQDRVREAVGAEVAQPLPGAGPPYGANTAVQEDTGAATIAVLAQLMPGATRAEVLGATIRLACLFRNKKSRASSRSVCNEVARGQLPAREAIAAVGSARGPGIRNPGAALTSHIKRCKAAAKSQTTEGASMDAEIQ
jgi:hypothetical protein